MERNPEFQKKNLGDLLQTFWGYLDQNLKMYLKAYLGQDKTMEPNRKTKLTIKYLSWAQGHLIDYRKQGQNIDSESCPRESYERH